MKESWVSSEPENAKFGDVVQLWLRRRGLNCDHGVIIVALGDGGFGLAALGPAPLTETEVFDFLRWVANQEYAV